MITLKEIAEKANVSRGTVDRVLHNRGRVSEQTMKKIQQIITKMNYKPNILARTLKLSKTYWFGVLMPKCTPADKYWELPLKGINKAQSELSLHDIKIEYFFYRQYSEDSFKKISRKAFQSDLDGLLIAPVQTKQAEHLFASIKIKIPYVLFGSNIPGSEPLTYIGQDSFQSGMTSARLMEVLLNHNGTVAVIRVGPYNFHTNERARGFEHYFVKKRGMKIHIFDIEYINQKSILNVLKKKMKSRNRFNGIFVTNAATYHFAEFIKAHGLKDKVHLIGYDLIDKNISWLKKGVIDFLISQKPFLQGYEGIYSLYKHTVLEEDCENRKMMPIDIISKENIKYI